MKKSILSLMLAFLLIFQYAMPVFAVQDKNSGEDSNRIDASVEYGSHSLDGKVPILGSQQIIPNMTAAFLYDPEWETVLYALNPDMPMYPASFVKIMTALLAVELGDLEEIITIKDSVLATLPKSAVNAHLQPNERMSLSDLLYCMMVGSANDAAAVIADHISGSQDLFVEEMNRKASELGCTGTVFTNPHGLMQDGQVTTARDVAKIVSYAMDNPDFMIYFSEEYYVVPETNEYASRDLYTNNYLMYSIDNMRIYRDYRTTGGRTGLDEYDRRCVASTAEDNGRTLVSVIFGAASVYDEERKTTITFGGFTETTQLLTMGFETVKPFQVMYDGQIFAEYPVANGENNVVVGSSESEFSVLPVDADAANLSFRFFDEENAFNAPIDKGQKLSNVQVWYNNICVAETELYAMSDVRTLSIVTEKKEIKASSGVWQDVLMIAVTIVVILIAIILLVRCIGIIRYVIIKKRRRHYGRSRRRNR